MNIESPVDFSEAEVEEEENQEAAQFLPGRLLSGPARISDAFLHAPTGVYSHCFDERLWSLSAGSISC